MKIEDLDLLIERWDAVCGSVTISIGDGVTADYAEDLHEVSKAELDHLVIRTEEPAGAISLRSNKAEFTYLEDPRYAATINTIKQSLKPFKIKTPYYRLKVFWAWLYVLVIMIAMFVDYKFHGFHSPPPLPPPPQVSIPLAVPPPPPITPPPPPFSTSLLVISLVTLILLTAWFIYSYTKIDALSSTRIIRKLPKETITVVDELGENPSQGI